jgi:signal peptidase II
MSIVKRLLLILFILVTCVGCDQASKVYAEAKLPKAQALSFLADTVRLQVTHNDGGFLSLGASLPKTWRLAALRAGVSAMLMALFAYALLAAVPRLPFILALILAGGASNLIDRFAHGGYVVDFINLGVGPIRTGIFNVADVAITVGVLTLFAQPWRGRQNGF